MRLLSAVLQKICFTLLLIVCTFTYNPDLCALTATWVVRCDEDLRIVQQFRQFSVLMHRYENIASANKVFINIELRYCRPIRILLDAYKDKDSISSCVHGELQIPGPGALTLSQLLVLQHVERRELRWVHAL